MNDKFVLIVLIALTVSIAILVILLIYTSIILASNKLYCKHYLRKDWDMWEKVIEKLKEHKGTIYVSKYDDNPKLNSFHIDIEIDSEKYELIYWVKRRSVSVHQGTDCTLCGFDKYHSDMAVKIIEEKINNAFENSSDECKQIATEILA